MADTPLSNDSIAVNLGEIRASTKPGVTLVAHALGSCVAVCAYDPVARVGAMAHIVLPTLPPFARNGNNTNDWPGKYADKAIPNLINQIEELGGTRSHLIFKIAGGSAVLNTGRPGSRLDVGQRNVQGVLNALHAAGFWPSAADLGGKQGRTLFFDPTTGQVRVRTVRGEEREY